VTESQESHNRWKQIVAKHRVTGVSVHDARLVAIMLTENIPSIFTLNEQDFRRYESEGIRVETTLSIVGPKSINS
jgi:predicted nucleic acid-binding protein